MKPVKTKRAPTDADLAQAFENVRGMLSSVELDWPQETAKDRIHKHKILKILMGAMRYPKNLKGAALGSKRNLDADLAVINDIETYGSLPKAIKAHMESGKLSRTTTERSHYDRIRLFRKHEI